MASAVFTDLDRVRLDRVRSHIDIALAGAMELAADLAKHKAGVGPEAVERAIRELERAKLRVEQL